MADAASIAPLRAVPSNSAGGAIRGADRSSGDRARGFQASFSGDQQGQNDENLSAAQVILPSGAALLSNSALLVLAETRTQESVANQTFPAPANLGRAIDSYNSAGGRSAITAIAAGSTNSL